MKAIRNLLIAATFLISIGCVKNVASKPQTKVVVTWYCKAEDKKWGNKIASTTERRAKVGRTAAVDPRLFPYGTKIEIPQLGNSFKNNGLWVAEDTGSAVKSRKASGGTLPIVDLYVGSRREMRLCAAKYPRIMEIILK